MFSIDTKKYHSNYYANDNSNFGCIELNILGHQGYAQQMPMSNEIYISLETLSKQLTRQQIEFPRKRSSMRRASHFFTFEYGRELHTHSNLPYLLMKIRGWWVDTVVISPNSNVLNFVFLKWIPPWAKIMPGVIQRYLEGNPVCYVTLGLL